MKVMKQSNIRRRTCQFLFISSVILASDQLHGSDAYSQPPNPARRYRPPSTSIAASRDTLPSPSQQPTSSEKFSITSPHKSLSENNEKPSRDSITFQPISLLIPFCVLMAVAMVAWEDYGASNLWPSRHMVATTSSMPNNNKHPSIYGLAFGKSERLQLLQQEPDTATTATSSLLPEIRAYNEVLEEHRMERVLRWNQPQPTDSQREMQAAVEDLQQILLEILKLQTLVQDYEWDSVHTIIQSSIVPKLEPAASVLRRQLSDNNSLRSNPNNYNIGYEEIGFDWGSCAWRHCGALADAQEALDELDHLLGVLEPPECLFCLNVAERSIRDMLAAVPPQYQALKGLPELVPYQSTNAVNNDGEFGEETDLLDQEYLRMLRELRSSSDVEDDAMED